jgi:uncharacterized protein YebE (UPF0316 family)
MFDTTILVTGLVIFFARICDVAIGTMRTIFTVQGRTLIAFCLATVEITIWVFVAGTVINQIHDQPLLVVFYALGYASGNAVGIMVERKLAFGLMVLRVISRSAGHAIADAIRVKGQPVTIFMGEGMRGPVAELYIACRRRDVKWILPIVTSLDPDSFYVMEMARDVKRVLKPTHTRIGGWRARSNRK